MAKKKNITFNDIAKYTNFSKTTISRYFNNPDSLTLENQKIISDALIALDYKENKVARILANGKTEFIGIIVPNIYLNYYSEMHTLILLNYEQFGYKYLVFAVNQNQQIARQYIQELLAYKIEGMIILSHTIPSHELASYQVPIVTIEREDKYVCSVNTDNYMGATQAASLLARHHCDVLIHINSKVPENWPDYQRIKGFQDFCMDHGVKNDIIYTELGTSFDICSKNLTSVFERLEEKYDGQKKGIFISGDTYANLFLNLIVRKYGFLPEDYFIIGFDNSPISREAIIPISTIGQQIDKLAHEAVSLLVELMNERKKRRPALFTQPIHRVVTPVLFRRETTEKDDGPEVQP